MIIALSAGRDSPAELRARLALTEEDQRSVLRQPRPGVGELAVLCTCHRTEVYATADGPEPDAVHVIAGLLPGLRPTDQHDLKLLDGSDAVEHLFKVAAGLDSLVVGEPQVLAQVRRSLVMAQQEKAAGPVLSNLIGRALRLGRRVRTETPLGRLAGSIGALAAGHLEHVLGGLGRRAGVVVGAGMAAGDAARALHEAGAALSVASRTPASAQRLAAGFDAEICDMDDLPRVLARADFAVVAVSGGMMLESSHIPARTSAAPLVVMDLSVPRAVEAPGRSDVELIGLEEIPGPRNPEITTAMIDAEAMVKKEVAELERWLDTRSSGPTIRDLRSQTESLVRAEVARTLAGMRLDEEDQEKVAALGMRIANKLIHGPTAALRDSDEDTRELIRKVFRLER